MSSGFSRVLYSDRIQAGRQGNLILQPRMGFGSITAMHQGLVAVEQTDPYSVGTLTIDSYTRVGDYASATKHAGPDSKLNGFPILSYSVSQLQELVHSSELATLPIQVRHGTAKPQAIFKRMTEIGLGTTEGGPVSYCLPYSRTPLDESIPAWEEACKILADGIDTPHIESFGGCMLGQLCPPSMLITISLLECLFFKRYGVNSMSLSFAQGTSNEQDVAAIKVLREFAQRLLNDCDWHVVMYTYMGVYPYTPHGALSLLEDSARLASLTQCERLIVKTKVESMQIPSVDDNLEAIQTARRAVTSVSELELDQAEIELYHEEIFSEVQQLLNAVLNLDNDISIALRKAFELGILDIPFCLHRDNAGQTRTYISENGALRWARIGQLPLMPQLSSVKYKDVDVTSSMLLNMLHYKSSIYDSGVKNA